MSVFIKKIKKNIKKFIPYEILVYRYSRQTGIDKEKLKQIRKYFLSMDKTKQNKEVAEIIEFFQKGNIFSVFPYDFPYQYAMDDIDVCYDKTCCMNFVMHCGNKMYFPQAWNSQACRSYYNALLIEQDIHSPHRYETPEFCVKDGDIIADIGAAEGIWALPYAEKAAKIYLFECSKHWIQAVTKTFEPWKDKVTIVNKYIGAVSGRDIITLDEFFGNSQINFIKADIEGAEVELLAGARGVLKNQNDLKILLCTYHREGDDAELKKCLEEFGFKTEYSDGYMLFIFDPYLKKPYIRRGVLRAAKQ